MNYLKINYKPIDDAHGIASYTWLPDGVFKSAMPKYVGKVLQPITIRFGQHYITLNAKRDSDIWDHTVQQPNTLQNITVKFEPDGQWCRWSLRWEGVQHMFLVWNRIPEDGPHAEYFHQLRRQGKL